MSDKLVWPPRHRRAIIEHARAAYAAHAEVMQQEYPTLSPMRAWDEQDAAVREAWIEAVTPEERTFP